MLGNVALAALFTPARISAVDAFRFDRTQNRLLLLAFALRLASVAASAETLTVPHVVAADSVLTDICAWHDRRDVVGVCFALTACDSSALSARPRICRQHSLSPGFVALADVASLRRCRAG